jgi:hypothetical protein
MPGKPENRESARELPHMPKSAGSGTVGHIEVGSHSEHGIKFKMQHDPACDHSRVRQSIGRK